MKSFRPPSTSGIVQTLPAPQQEATTGTDDDQFDETFMHPGYNPTSTLPGGVAQVWEPLTPYHNQRLRGHHRVPGWPQGPPGHIYDHPLFNQLLPQKKLGKSPSVKSMPAGNDHQHYSTMPHSGAGGQHAQGSSTMPRYRAEAVIQMGNMGSRSHHGYADGQGGRRPHSSMSHASTKSAPDVIVLH